MTSFLSLTADRVKVYEQETGMKFESCGKLCDFCDCLLPLSWISIQCIVCPTIYDICDTCLKNRDVVLDVCHQHVVASPVPNNPEQLTLQEKAMIMSHLSPKTLVYAEFSVGSIHSHLCDYCKDNFDNPDVFEASRCKNYQVKLISLQKLIDECSPGDCDTLREICKQRDIMVQAHNSCAGILIKI